MNTNMQSTITITFGDVAENHVGMQQIGNPISNGLNYDDLFNAKTLFEKNGITCELIDLNIEESKDAYVLIIRDGVNCMLQNKIHNDLFNEQLALDYDKKAYMYGRIVNKKARYNLCFSDTNQEPDYNSGKGRVVAFDDVIITKQIRDNLDKYFGDKARGLVGEGNYYYDINQCGIGFHGDTERRIVIAIRLGASLPLHYQWYYKGNPVGNRIVLTLNGGDIYAMSEKATGNDWKKKNIHTLRHATGCTKYL